MKSSVDRNIHYYRYCITELSLDFDLSDETCKRRRLKKEQSFATHFVYDLTTLSKHSLTQKQSQLLALTGHFYLTSDQYEYFKPQDLTYIEFKTNEQFIAFQKLNSHNVSNVVYLFSPEDSTSAYKLLAVTKSNASLIIQWQFKNYNPQIKNSLTIEDISKLVTKFQLPLTDLPFYNQLISSHYELETVLAPKWSMQSSDHNIRLSIIIPTYNNCIFLCNVIRHLLNQSIAYSQYEIIIVDDGSTDQTSETLYALLKSNINSINLKYIYWPKSGTERGEQNFFRAGHARNCGVSHSTSDWLFFLDSDMLVPFRFIETVFEHFTTSDVIQFSRYHIYQQLSLKNPNYSDIDLKNETYIEEKNYWNIFFPVLIG